MLGISPLSSRSISGGPMSLTIVVASLAALGTITFGGLGTIGAFTPMSATGSLTFGGNAVMVVNQALGASGSITFGGTPLLRTAGKPIKLVALSQSYDIRAVPTQYTLKAVTQSFTLRGNR